MKLVLQQFVSLDGVSQGPGSPDEDVSGGFSRGGWFVPYVDDMLAALLAVSAVPALASDTSADRKAVASTTDEVRAQAGHAHGDATRPGCDHCQGRS